MRHVHGGGYWATPVWEKPVDIEVAEWTRAMLEQTRKMRTLKCAVSLTMPRQLRKRLGLASPAVLLTVNGSVRLTSDCCSEPICVLNT